MDSLVGRSDPLSVAFRCDGSKTIGSGHVMRCLTLADELQKHAAEITFLCTDETIKTVSLLANSPYAKKSETHTPKVDWLVIDHYNIDANYESAARNWAKNILVIDDLANRPHDCDILVDMTYGRDANDYEMLVTENCKINTGAEFALLRPEFSNKSAARVNGFSDAHKVLISYGGVNPKASTDLALTMLNAYKDRALNIDVVTGGNAVGLDKIRNLVSTIEQDKFHTITLHIDTAYIADLMVKADLCLGAGGTTSWERCCLGLPTLAIEVADNQAKILKELDDSGALKNLGQIENINHEVFLEQFSKLITDESALKKMSDAAFKICDGQGAARVAKEMT